MAEDAYPRRLPSFGGHQQRILDIVRKRSDRGIGGNEIADLLYADDPNGGPLGAQKVVQTQICFINKKLRASGVAARIKSTGGRGGRYFLESFASDDKIFLKREISVSARAN